MYTIRNIKQCKYPYHNLWFIGDGMKGKTLYKYMPFDVAITCLQNNTLRFQLPSRWKDPFEGYFYTANYDNVMPEPPFDTNAFACCFTRNPDCEAAWNMYTENMINNPCVQFKLYPGQLRRHAEKFVQDNNGTMYEGVVCYEMTEYELLHLYQRRNPKYSTFFQEFSRDKYLNLLLLKRPFFNYEGEVRYFIQGDRFNYGDGHIDVTIPWSLCLYSVKLPPYCSEEKRQQLRDSIQQNYERCRSDYPNYHPSNVPQIENTLYVPLSQITIE